MTKRIEIRCVPSTVNGIGFLIAGLLVPYLALKSIGSGFFAAVMVGAILGTVASNSTSASAREPYPTQPQDRHL